MINIPWTKFEQKSIVTFISEQLPERGIIIEDYTGWDFRQWLH